MMHNDSGAILDDILSRWHSWARGFKVVPTCGADPMFRNAKSGKSWDSTEDIVDDEIEGKTMEAVDFHVGEMPDDPGRGALRSAIYVHARNCYTGRSVWLHPRLPKDPIERGEVLRRAKSDLLGRLSRAGVI